MTPVDARDVVIIGSGPAGCAAALYAARAGLGPIVLEQAAYGGQIVSSSMVENYPGVASTDGYTLMETMRAQAEGFGAEFMTADVSSLSLSGDIFHLSGSRGEILARTVIACLGSDPKEAGFEGEARFRGHGVSYCATCDAMFFRNKQVFVYGGGNSAAEEAIMLSEVAKEVVIVVRKPSMRAEKSLVQRLELRENVKIMYETCIRGIDGDELPKAIFLENLRTGEVTRHTYEKGSFGVFVYVGRKPNTGILGELAELEPDGHVVADEWMRAKTPGLFVAGDCRSKVVRQIVTAVSDGAIAALGAAKYLKERSNINP